MIRAASECRTPIVSAIGHEPDSPLLDLVADVRASTPTDAAKHVVPDVGEEQRRISLLQDRARRCVATRIDRDLDALRGLRARPALATPTHDIDRRAAEIDGLVERTRRCMQTALDAISGRRRAPARPCPHVVAGSNARTRVRDSAGRRRTRRAVVSCGRRPGRPSPSGSLRVDWPRPSPPPTTPDRPGRHYPRANCQRLGAQESVERLAVAVAKSGTSRPGPTLMTMAQPTAGPSYEAARDELLEVVRQLEAAGFRSSSRSPCGSAAKNSRPCARPGSTARTSGSRRGARANDSESEADAGDPPEAPDRNLALELVRVTEAAAMAAGRWVGLGEKNDADAAAVDAMRRLIGTVSMRGRRRDRRGREGRRADALQRRADRRRHRPRSRRRGRPDRRHPAGGDGHEQRDLGDGGGRARLDVRPVGGVLHGEAGHRADGRAVRRHRSPGRDEHQGGRQGERLRDRRRHRRRPRSAPPRRARPRDPRSRCAHQVHPGRRRRRRDHGRARRHRHRPAARRRRNARGHHRGLRGQVPRRRHPGQAVATRRRRTRQGARRRPRPRRRL